MIPINKKRGQSADIAKALQNYVRSKYSDQEYQQYKDRLNYLGSCRTEALTATDRNDSHKEALMRYLSLLCAIENRFPFGTNDVKLHFTWCDAFSPQKKCTESSIYFEKASVLFNIAACTSFEAVRQNRSTDEGFKETRRLLQETAGWLDYLREYLRKTPLGPLTQDLSENSLVFLSMLMVAQGMEIVFEKVAAGSMQPINLAKIAMRTACLYEEAVQRISNEPLRSLFDRSWHTHLQVKHLMLRATARYQYSLVVKEGLKYGEQVGHLTDARACCQELQRHTRNVDAILRGMIERLSHQVEDAYLSASNDNDRIYIDVVPAPAQLPPVPVQDKLLIVPTPPAEPQAPEDDPFRDLVPLGVVRHASMYSERVADLIRQTIANMEEMTLLAKNQVDSVGTYRGLEMIEQRSGIPPTITTKCLELQQHGGFQRYQTLYDELGNMRRECHSKIDTTMQELQRKQQRAGILHQSPLVEPFLKEGSNFREKITMAAGADAEVQSKMTEHRELIEKIAQAQDLSSLLPVPTAALPQADPSQSTLGQVAADLKRLLQELQQIFDRRGELAGELQQMASVDNIVPVLLQAGEAPPQSIFDEHLAKYNPKIEEHRALLSQQERVLGQIVSMTQRLYAEQGNDPAAKLRETALTRIDAACKAHEQIKEHLRQAIAFYSALLDRLKAFEARAQDATKDLNLPAPSTPQPTLQQQMNPAATQPQPQPQPTPGTSAGAGGYNQYMPTYSQPTSTMAAPQQPGPYGPTSPALAGMPVTATAQPGGMPTRSPPMGGMAGHGAMPGIGMGMAPQPGMGMGMNNPMGMMGMPGSGMPPQPQGGAMPGVWRPGMNVFYQAPSQQGK